jgi:hypothetical protein
LIKGEYMPKTKFKEADRKNHVPALCEKRKLDKAVFLREAGYLCSLARPTLEKAYRGDTDLEYDTIEKLAWFFDVPTCDILESRFA